MYVAHLEPTDEVVALLQDAAGPGARLSPYDDSWRGLVVGWRTSGGIVCAADVSVADDVATIEHLATVSARRGHGYGRLLVTALADQLAPLPLLAETDDDAVGFYRALGFDVVEVDSPWSTRRYRCTLRP